jgi:hypothetical protein
MKAIFVATALVILAGCAGLDQQAAQGGTSPAYARQYNNPYPYSPPHGM